jgi:hypothetical protein
MLKNAQAQKKHQLLFFQQKRKTAPIKERFSLEYIMQRYYFS